MKRIAASKKALVIASASLLVLIIAGGLAWYTNHTRTPSSEYVSTCSRYRGNFDFYGADNIRHIADEYSKAIVTATVDNPKALGESIRSDDPPPRITITQILKGTDGLRKGDTIPICPGLGYIDFPKGEHPTVLVFLDSKDGDVWVPGLGSLGIIPEGKNGRFDLSNITSNPKTATVSELQKLIK